MGKDSTHFRRIFLKIAGTALSASLAGCTSDDANGDESTGGATEEDESTDESTGEDESTDEPTGEPESLPEVFRRMVLTLRLSERPLISLFVTIPL